MSRQFTLALLLITGACDDFPRARTRAEIEDIATDVAADVAAGQTERIEALDRRTRELEEKLDRLDDREGRLTDATIKDLQTVNDRITRFQDVYNRHTH